LSRPGASNCFIRLPTGVFLDAEIFGFTREEAELTLLRQRVWQQQETEQRAAEPRQGMRVVKTAGRVVEEP
jgi:hypothetical protein